MYGSRHVDNQDCVGQEERGHSYNILPSGRRQLALWILDGSHYSIPMSNDAP